MSGEISWYSGTGAFALTILVSVYLCICLLVCFQLFFKTQHNSAIDQFNPMNWSPNLILIVPTTLFIYLVKLPPNTKRLPTHQFQRFFLEACNCAVCACTKFGKRGILVWWNCYALPYSLNWTPIEHLWFVIVFFYCYRYNYFNCYWWKWYTLSQELTSSKFYPGLGRCLTCPRCEIKFPITNIWYIIFKEANKWFESIKIKFSAKKYFPF